MDTKRLPEIIIELYRLTEELERMFPGRHFTLDGHLVGSIGEVLAAHYYGVQLLTASHKGHDAFWNKSYVEIKATQGNSVALRHLPEFLLVLKLHRHGAWEEIYNGPGQVVWNLFANKTRPSNGQFSVRLSILKELMNNIPITSRIPLIHPVITPD